MGKIRLLVADGNRLFCAGVSMLLKGHPEVEVIGEAHGERDAVRMTRQHRPDVVLLDTSLPPCGGIKRVRQIRSRDTRVLLVSEDEDIVRVFQGLRAGASGYLPMSVSVPELVSSIKTVHRSGFFLYPPLARKMVRGYFRMEREPGYEMYDILTPREREVLRLAAEGRRNAEIASRLGITVRTASKHRARLAKKLNGHIPERPRAPEVYRRLLRPRA